MWSERTALLQRLELRQIASAFVEQHSLSSIKEKDNISVHRLRIADAA